jgi:hypothetical protein
MTNASLGDVAATAEAIRRYLQAHPDASDAVEGVMTWWLGPQEFAPPSDHVGQALNLLVLEGVVKRKRLPDGTALYAAADRQR